MVRLLLLWSLLSSLASAGETLEDYLGTKERPWINVYVNRTGCPACERFKNWLRKQKDLPCEFRLRELNHPAWLKAVPAFHWNVGDKSYLEYGWSGPEGFFPKYESTNPGGEG